MIERGRRINPKKSDNNKCPGGVIRSPARESCPKRGRVISASPALTGNIFNRKDTEDIKEVIKRFWETTC